jgi:hypothetical protein
MNPDDFRILCAIFGVAFVLIIVYRRWRKAP